MSDSGKPLFSIIVPVYRCEQYLKTCFDSVLNQTFGDFQLVLVDDGTPDNGGKICDDYAALDSRVKAVHKKNGGLASARNSGLDASDGEYIMFLDCDDFLAPETLGEIKKHLNADRMICFGYSTDFADDGFSIKSSFPEEDSGKPVAMSKFVLLSEADGQFNINWNKVYSKKVICDNNIRFTENTTPGEDLIFNCDYCVHVSECLYINSHFYHYMKYGQESLVVTYKKDLERVTLLMCGARKKMYSQLDINDYTKNSVYCTAYAECYFCCVPNMYRKNSDLTGKERKQLFIRMKNDSELMNCIEFASKENPHIKTFCRMLGNRSPAGMNRVYSLLFFMRNTFGTLYKTFRKKVVFSK